MLEDKRLCLQYVLYMQIQAHIRDLYIFMHMFVYRLVHFFESMFVYFLCTIYIVHVHVHVLVQLFMDIFVFIIMKMFVYTFILMDSFIYMFMSYNVLAHGNTHVHKQVREHVDINFLRVALSL